MTQRRAYPSDVSDAQWALIAPVLESWRAARLARDPVGNTPKYGLREIWNAILYLNRAGCPWEYLPHEFPHFRAVYFYFGAWRDEGIFARLNTDVTRLARIKAGRSPEPTAAIIDTQSVKTSGNVRARDQGADAAKRIVGRKRGISTDTLGLLLAVIVMAASATENQAGISLLSQAKAAYPTISKAWTDEGFKKQAVEHGARLGVNVEIVPRRSDIPGFHVLKRRWVVERTFGWLMLRRRLARDYETHARSSESMIYIAMTGNLTKRINGTATPTWHGA